MKLMRMAWLKVEERAGGWFVEYEDGSLGGPWKTKEEALLAAAHDYLGAAKAEKGGSDEKA